MTVDQLAECFEFDHLVVAGNSKRRSELSLAAEDERMYVATVNHRAAGYSVLAPWFLGAPFLALLYVDAALRGRGIEWRPGSLEPKAASDESIRL